MTKFSIFRLAAGSCLLALAPPLMAHHSFAMFDQSKKVEFTKVTVTKFMWTNPHSFVVVQNGDTIYTLECSSPNLMTHQGWSHNTIKPGEQISVAFYPLRNGKAGGMLKTVTLANGKQMSAW